MPSPIYQYVINLVMSPIIYLKSDSFCYTTAWT